MSLVLFYIFVFHHFAEIFLYREDCDIEGYGFEVDWWSYGILLHEMAFAFAPFDIGPFDDAKTVVIKALEGSVKFSSKDMAQQKGSPSFADLLSNLLVWLPNWRIGEFLIDKNIDKF